MIGDLPNLIVIGAMKAGTSSLHNYLKMHPDIQMSEPKELDFFIHPIDEEYPGHSKWNLGFEWYKEHFDSTFKVRGESSQNYTKCHKFPRSPELIHEHFPEAKLIYIVRDPIDRFVSNVSEIQFGSGFFGDVNTFDKRSFEELEKDPIILTGMYSFQIKQYLKYFNINSIKVVFFEELIVNKEKVLNNIFEFLGLAPIDDSQLFDFASNVSAEKETENKLTMAIIKGQLTSKMLHLISNHTRQKIKRNSVIRKIFYRSVSKGKLSEELKYKLQKIYSEDVSEFKKIINQKELPFRNFS